MAKTRKAFDSAIGCVNSFRKRRDQRVCLIGVLIRDGTVRSMTDRQINRLLNKAKTHPRARAGGR